MQVIIMGVCGCGKSSLGRALAQLHGLPFIEGDDLHPAANVTKMSQGTPLTDKDRWPWLDAVGTAMTNSGSSVASCSSLRRTYRDRLRTIVGSDLRFILPSLPRSELEKRLFSRTGHYMPPTLLDSQLNILEAPRAEEGDVIILDGVLERELILKNADTKLTASYNELASKTVIR